jgi:hypothetical protein
MSSGSITRSWKGIVTKPMGSDPVEWRDAKVLKISSLPLVLLPELKEVLVDPIVTEAVRGDEASPDRFSFEEIRDTETQGAGFGQELFAIDPGSSFLGSLVEDSDDGGLQGSKGMKFSLIPDLAEDRFDGPGAVMFRGKRLV